MVNNQNNQRITSIDALRAVTLFGILMVHTSVLFSFINGTNVFDYSSFGNLLNNVSRLFLQYRCNKIFGILFGVSFYLILRKPEYSSGKFVWRCVLLMGIGLLNKFFYTVDALMWYGIWGGVLVLFRNLTSKKLFVSFCIVFVLSAISYDFGFFLIKADHLPLARYDLPTTLKAVVSYPVWRSALDYIMVVSQDPLSCLWQFLFGYYLAKKGVIDNLKEYLSGKRIMVFGLVYAITLVMLRIDICVVLHGLMRNLAWLFGALFYSIVFLWIYHRLYPRLRFFEAYGRLGLTNYSMQGICGVILAVMVYIPFHWDIQYVYLASVLFFVLQSIFSIIWLRYFSYGPMEWVWRCLTNLRYINPLKKNNK